MPVTSWMLRRGSLLLLQVVIVTLCVCVTTLVAVRVQEAQIRTVTIERVTDVAESLARLPAVIGSIGTPDDTEVLQPLTDLVQEASGVDYVVITDTEGIRITHPNPAMVGLPVSTDPSAVLRGERFIGTEVGTLGSTVRAKVPVFSDGQVVGTASVGLLERHLSDDLEHSVGQLAPWVLGSLVLGFIAATAVDTAVRRRVARLELDQRELEVQRRLAAVLREQTHEFTNRLHVLYGMVEADERGDALDFIGSLVPVTRGADALVADPRLAAVLAAHATELARGGGELRLLDGSAVQPGQAGDAALTVTANLLANAVEATDAGGRVDVLVTADENGFSIRVDDDGPGLDLEARSRLFERGFSTKRRARQDGVEIPRGVGLALVRDLVRRNRGVLDVGASPAGGARFSVSLPVDRVGTVPS
jgi:two-component system CitB family sensor kinase